MPKDQYYQDAVRYAREKGFQGNTLPHYDRCSINVLGWLGKCPLEKAIPGSIVGCEQITIKGKVESLPRGVVRFIDLADRGKYEDVVGRP